MRYFVVLFAVIFLIAAKRDETKQSKFEQLELFNKVLHLVDSQYYRDVSTEKLIEGAIKGMMDTLDPHSNFLNKEYFKKMQEDTAGEFGGLGLEVSQKDGVVVVITPIMNSPAQKAGILPRDKIVEINHESIVGLSLNEALDRMKGKRGEKTHLGIVRKGVEGVKHYNIKREVIKINPVVSELIDNEVAFIKLTQFQSNAAESVEKSLKKMKALATKKKSEVKYIILDLRSNPGGLLDEAVNLSSIFLSSGVVVSTEARDPQNKDIRYVRKNGYKDIDTPLAVLINGSSASASEIVAGAIQDYKRGIIMGSTSFGKGSVQTMVPLDHGTGLKLTIAQYMTPEGRKIQAKGIKPDIKISDVDQDLFQDALKEDDAIRERDLKNYLSATIETDEEKNLRLKRDRELRKKRIASQKNKKKKEKSIFDKYDPKGDYQVRQAIKVLKTANFWIKKNS